jgi:hypothetical protein
MIERPRRSVTRFFIPLIDVLILLFCIFLLMPFMNQPGNAESADRKKTESEAKELSPDDMRRLLADLRFDLERARKEASRLRSEQRDPTERLSVCVLEIDPKDGKLIYFKGGERIPVVDARIAQDVINDHKRRSSIGKDPLFVILMPRIETPFPTGKQFRDYSNWFKDVPHRIDDPFRPPPAS